MRSEKALEQIRDVGFEVYENTIYSEGFDEGYDRGTKETFLTYVALVVISMAAGAITTMAVM